MFKYDMYKLFTIYVVIFDKGEKRMLVLATVSESRELLHIQQQGFADLYTRYQEPYNPAIEDLEHFQSRFQREGCSFYKIVEEGETIGLLRVTIAEDRNLGWVGLLVLLSEYRKKGYASKALLEVERQHPTVSRWVLCTISQEESLVTFYQKLGYKGFKVCPEYKGEEVVYDLIYMEKWLKEEE